jgi:hypothetical protein
MKIRSGFVSNSSSSSFVVAFPKGFIPSLENVQHYLFGPSPVIWEGNDVANLTATEAAARIYQDMRGQTPNDQALIMETLENGYVYGGVDYQQYVKADRHTEPEAYEAEKEAYARVEAAWRRAWIKTQMTKMPAEQFDLYVFEYEDKERVSAALERANVFEATPYAKVSNH